MKHPLQNKNKVLFLAAMVLFLSGCSSFAGLRTPKYDGEPIERDEEAIDLYAETQQINAENEEHYLRYPLSDTLSEPSLDFNDEERVELQKGTYTVGEDLPAGRAVLAGHPSDFSPEVFIINAGNLTVYDKNDEIAFENHFQERSGVMQAVIDLRDGQRLDVEGDEPKIDVHYTEEVLSIPPQSEDTDLVTLIAGHYEVGRHFEPGTFTIQTIVAPRTPVMYHFTNGDMTVVELTNNRGVSATLTEEDNEELYESGRITEEEYEQNLERFDSRPPRPTIELMAGDKLYLPMIDQLILEKE